MEAAQITTLRGRGAARGIRTGGFTRADARNVRFVFSQNSERVAGMMLGGKCALREPVSAII